MLASEEVSNLENAGLSSRSQLWVGTPTKAVTRSASISRSATSGSQRYIITSFIFSPKHESMTGTQPVTWKSGTTRMKAGFVAAAAFVSPSRSWRAASMAARAQKAIRDWVTARWVDTAPLGNPVVPDV